MYVEHYHIYTQYIQHFRYTKHSDIIITLQRRDNTKNLTERFFDK